MLSWGDTDTVVTFKDFKEKMKAVAGGPEHQNQKFYKSPLVGRYRVSIPSAPHSPHCYSSFSSGLLSRKCFFGGLVTQRTHGLNC